VQSARELVGGFFRKLTAGVQARENQFDAGDLLLGMDIDRHAAGIIRDRKGAILEERDIDPGAIP
jgi:hypothetical protein